MKSTSVYITYFGFIIEFVIPKGGHKWETQIISIFQKNYFGFFPITSTAIREDIAIHFVASKLKGKLSLNKFTYIVPTKENSLEYKKFGQLMREILITTMLFLTKKKGGVCLHASSAAYKGNAALFVGNSGSGKSTICQLLPKDFIKLTDDTTFLVRKKNWITSPLPIFEKKISLRIRSTTSQFNVVAICFIKQSTKNSITKLTKDVLLFQKLLDNTLYTGHPYELDHVRSLMKKSIPFYQIEFTKSKKIGNLLKQYLR